MTQLLGNLGIDLPLLLAQIVNFAILLFLLKKFLYRPMIARIEADEQQLEAVARQKKQLEEEEARLNKARAVHEAESKRLAADTIRDAERIAHEIRERARDEARKEKDAVVAQIHSRLVELDHDQT